MGVSGGEHAADLRLTAPAERTSLPAIRRAMPILELFGKVVGRRHAVYKIALLKELQALGLGHWRLGEIKDAIWWLEPQAVTLLVGDLKDAAFLLHEPLRNEYRLTNEGRVVTAVLDALTMPEVEPRRMINYLSAAITMALAGGAGPEAALGSFASAIAILRDDLEELRRLAHDGSREALWEAAVLVQEHARDMDRLLTEHEEFQVVFRDTARVFPSLHTKPLT
jgi:hypothetical protein